MNAPHNRTSRISISLWIGGLLFWSLWTSGCGRKPEVEAVRVQRGEIRESFSEPARTRLGKTYRITMPIDGRIGRIDLEPGDAVKAGQLIVEFNRIPLEQAVAEARAAIEELKAQIAVKDDNQIEETALVESLAAVQAASEALNAANAQVLAEEARADRATKERDRMRKLSRDNAIPESQLDDAELEAETSLIELRRQEFYRAAWNAMMVIVNLGPRYVEQYLSLEKLQREVVVHQLAQAQARLVRAEHDLDLAVVRSPIDGVILERYEQGDRTLPAGQPLILIGNLNQLEAIAEVLTQDALSLSPGSEVSLQAATRLQLIPGKVKRIEPSGFTKLSSLGIEQQRVNVIIALKEIPSGLGAGFRVQAGFLTGSKSNTLIVPRYSVMQSTDNTFFVYRIEGNVLRKQTVTLGLRSDLEIEIIEGLSEGDSIVTHPDTTLEDGQKVSIQN